MRQRFWRLVKLQVPVDPILSTEVGGLWSQEKGFDPPDLLIGKGRHHIELYVSIVALSMKMAFKLRDQQTVTR